MLSYSFDPLPNIRRHSATGKKPLERFTDGIECIRSTPDNLKDHFRKTVRRRVNQDRTITLDKRLYEGPVAVIGKQVELLFHENEYDRVELRYQNKTFGFINRVDLNVNCRVKRDKNNNPVISVSSGHLKGSHDPPNKTGNHGYGYRKKNENDPDY